MKSTTFVDIFDLHGRLLQSVEFHTSCSQPLRLGDQYGSLQLAGFTDEDGNVDALPPDHLGEDADDPPGPVVAVGDTMVWSYIVNNTGHVNLTDVRVTDDRIGPVPCPKTTLNVSEAMTCTASGTAGLGQYVNNGTAFGPPPAGPAVSDTDQSHYFGVLGGTGPAQKGKVKGKGYILSPFPSQEKDNRAKFSFKVHSKDGRLKGKLKYHDHVLEMKVKSNNVMTLTVDRQNKTASFSGFAKNTHATKEISMERYTVTVWDYGKKGKGIDRFTITLDSGYTAGGVLMEGDIKIYQKD